MKTDYNHLSEDAKKAIDFSIEDRIKYIYQDMWMGYPQAKMILKNMEELIRMPKIERMPNMILIGETNNGKTALLKKLAELFPIVVDSNKGNVYRPVFLIQAQPSPDEGRLYGQILTEAFHPYGKSEHAASKQQKVIEVLKRLNVKVLVIDEFHHVLTGTAMKQRQFLNVIKFLANELKISIIAAGVKEAYYTLSTDSQLMNRFKPAILPKWELNEDYYRLLATFENKIPLKEKSNLLEGTLPSKILSLSEGTIGEISTIIKSAAKLAIELGKEKITSDIIDKTDYISPSRRKHLIDKVRA